METFPQEPPRKRWHIVLGRKMIFGGISVLFLVALYFVYAIKENLQGAGEWSQAKEQLKSAGISIDPKDYLPSPVPDAENFGALPIFQFTPDPQNEGRPTLAVLHQAFNPFFNAIYYPTQKYSPGKVPYLGDWPKKGSVDLDKLKNQLTEYCRLAKPPIAVPPNATPSEIFGLICPILAELRAENQRRSRCWFDFGDWSPDASQAPQRVDLATAQIRLAKALSYDETLAQLDGHPQKAVDDFAVGWKIDSGMRQQPSVMVGLVEIGVAAIQRGVLQQELNQHFFNDSQLKQIDDGLGQADFLAEAQFCYRGDFAAYLIPLAARFKKDPLFWVKESRRLSKEYNAPQSELFFLGHEIYDVLIPSGLQERGLAEYATYLLPGEKQLLDLPSRRIFPDREATFPPEEKNTMLAHPANYLRNGMKQFAYSQDQTDEARIVCRLERYRLAHGAYPASLDALTDYGPLPHDILNGEPFHYKLNGDGTYSLYSVGWNQKDDGGDGGTRAQLYQDRPDWVWDNSPTDKKK